VKNPCSKDKKTSSMFAHDLLVLDKFNGKELHGWSLILRAILIVRGSVLAIKRIFFFQIGQVPNPSFIS